MINTVASILLGSSLSQVLTKLIIKHTEVNLFGSNIPSLGPALSQSKTFDLVDFALTTFFSLAFFLAARHAKRDKTAKVFYLAFSFAAFISVHFVEFRSIVVLPLIFLIVLLPKNIRFKPDFILAANAFLTALYLVILKNFITLNVTLTIFIFLTSFLLYGVSEKNKFFRSPGHLVLSASVVFASSLTATLFVGALSVLSVFFLRNYQSKLFTGLFYPSVVIFLLVFDPLFFTGRFDSVEEGFWLSWVYRLKQGDALYRDAAAYHPPLMPYLIKISMDAFGASLYSFRAVLHALQIGGVVIFYFTTRHFVKNRVLLAVAVVVYLGFSQGFVRNNIEIRLGLGLLAMLLAFGKKYFSSGVTASVSALMSVEVGLVTLFLLSVFYRKKRFYAGALAIFVPFALWMAASGSLVPMISQIAYYAGSFSNGYLNAPVERSIQTSLFHWHLFWEYTASTAFLWEAARGITLAGIVHSLFIRRNREVFILSLFNFLLFRTALGRSDFEHLLFVLPAAIIILMRLTERYAGGNRIIISFFAFSVLFVFAREWVNTATKYPARYLFRIQVYGREVGELEIGYHTPDLVVYLKENTPSEQKIFAYPWLPEIYFLANRQNATSFDTPLAFFTQRHQAQMIAELEMAPQALVVYNQNMAFAGLTADSLPVLNKYITDNYHEIDGVGDVAIMARNE